MLKRIEIDLKLNLKKQLKSIGKFIKDNLANLLIVSCCFLCSTFLTSFGIKDSSSALRESASFSIAQVAKDNSYNKVHIETKLDFNSTGDTKANTGIFTKSHSFANRAFINYSSAAFLTRNNFYNVAIENNVEDEVEYSRFVYTFGDMSFESSNITPSTNSEIVKKYTTNKYVDGKLVNYEMSKKRLETIDLFLLGDSATEGSGLPIFVPDYVVQQMLDENGSTKDLKGCIGLSGKVNINTLDVDVYIKNIIVTSEHNDDPNDISDHSFTLGNVRFSNFLKEIFGNYTLLFYSPTYSFKRCLACADFDSEYFKIDSYLSNELLNIVGENSSSMVYSYQLDKETNDMIHLKNDSISNMLNSYLGKAINHKANYFDGKIVLTILGILSFIATVTYFVVLFAKGKMVCLKKDYRLLLFPFSPFIVLNIFSAIFIFVFHSKIEFIAFSFAGVPLISLIYFAVFLIASLFCIYSKDKEVKKDD